MPESSSDDQELPQHNDEEEDDLDQLLAALQDPVSSKPKLNRLKRARADGRAVEPPVSKRVEVEDPSATQGVPSNSSAESSDGGSSDASAPQASPSHAADEEEEQGDAAKSKEAKAEQQGDSRKGDKYWDEEDEQEESVMRRDLGQIKDYDANDSVSGSDGSKSSDNGDDDADSDNGPMDPKELAAETQRVLRDAARSDRIGKGAAPQIQPLSGVLAKIMQRKEEAMSRAARNSSRPAIAKTPPAKKQLQARPQPAIPSHNLEEDDGDLVLVDSDDDTEVAQKAAAKRALAQEDSQLFGLESQSLPDKPSLTTSTTPAQAKPKPLAGLMSFMQRGPLLDTQDVLGREPVASKLQAPGEEAGVAPAIKDSEGIALNLCLDSEIQPESPAQADTCMQDSHEEPGIEEQAVEDAGGNSEGPADEQDAEEEEEGGSGEEGAASEEEGDADDEGKEDEEEEFWSSDDSSSDEEEEEENVADKEIDSAAKQQALEELRALLRDEPRAKNKSAYFEDEAEMSEDGGHSDDGESDGEDDEQDGILEDLIGMEKDGRHDEKRRAALHAAWLERQDEAVVEQLMHGIKNGFRRKRSALDDEGGTNYEAALRRAALMNSDEEAASESEEEEEEEQAEDPFENIDALSDEEAKEELREAQQRRLMEESQKEEDNIVTLLDDESRAVLGLLQRGASSAAAPPPVLQSRPNFSSELTNRPAKGSFLKRGSSSNPMALLAKSGSQMGNTRSFVFGCENSNSGVAAPDADSQGGGAPAAPAGPTSFAGISVGSAAAGIKPGKASGAHGPSNLLGMLHSKMTRKACSYAEPEKDAAGMQMRSIMTSKKSKQTLARRS
ncbi:g2499 [Coccomyxa elongata]